MFDNYCLRAARYLGFFAREFGLDVSDAIIASIDEDFVDVAKGVRDAAAIKSSYPSKSGRSVPELPPAEFPSTHSATDRIRGIRRQRDFQSVIRDTKSLSGEGGVREREGMSGGRVLYLRQPAHAIQAFGAFYGIITELEASGCPRGT